MKHIYLLLTVFLLTACGTSKHLQNSLNNPVPSGLTTAQIKEGIIKAGAKRGWIIKESSAHKNLLEGDLTVRHHRVSVQIPVSTSEYSINYVSSVNMDYDQARNLIHRSYLRWVSYLKQDIDTMLSLIKTLQ